MRAISDWPLAVGTELGQHSFEPLSEVSDASQTVFSRRETTVKHVIFSRHTQHFGLSQQPTANSQQPSFPEVQT